MSLKSRLLSACGIVVLGLALTSSSLAQEIPKAGACGVTAQAEAPFEQEAPFAEADSTEDTISLEELEKLVGAQRMCGIFCGRNDPSVTNCTFACGDAAMCWHGSCIYR